MGAVAPTWCHPEGLSPPILVPQAQTHSKSTASLLFRLDQCLSVSRAPGLPSILWVGLAHEAILRVGLAREAI